MDESNAAVRIQTYRTRSTPETEIITRTSVEGASIGGETMDKRLPSSLMILLLPLLGSTLEAAPTGESQEESKSVSPSAEAAAPLLETINSDILAISREIRSAHDRLGANKRSESIVHPTRGNRRHRGHQ
jgi:hypothetical protein